MEEIWKPIKYKGIDYTGIYEVSNLGRVKSLRSNKFLKLYEAGRKHTRYYEINLCLNSIRIHARVHVLVFIHFSKEKHDTKLVIDHIDGNPLNNNIKNLQQITNRANCSKERTQKSGLPVGVCKISSNKYLSSIRISSHGNVHLGYYKYELHASEAYKIALDCIKNDNCSKEHVQNKVSEYRVSIGMRKLMMYRKYK